jgi:phosphomannomutase
MVSVSGVRGIVGEGLSPEAVLGFAQAFGTYVKGGKVVVGRDSRVSGDMVKNAVCSGLLAVGCDILDIGVCPTPTTQIAVEHLDAKGAIMITASHNPIMWNGLKLIGPDGLFLDAEQGQEVLQIAESRSFSFASWEHLGVAVTYGNAIQEHIDAILKLPYLDLERIKERSFKVVLDCVCGAGSNLVPQLLTDLGCLSRQLHCKPTGLFPRNPEPLPENLSELGEIVREEQADIGIAVDPDSDRLALVSEQGEPLGEERTLAIVTDFVLQKHAGPVAINASTSRVNEDIAEKYGVPLTRTKVGEIHVAKKMREIGAVIGGEGNGGVILPEVHLGRDAPIGIALVLQALVESGQTISALNQSLPQYSMTKDKVELSDIEPSQALDRIREIYADESLDFTDGVKIVRPQSWIHVRSATSSWKK